MKKTILFFFFVLLLPWASCFSSNLEVQLAGWWRLDEESGNYAMDSSGNDNNGYLYGNILRIEGYLGGALHFSGGYVRIPDSVALRPSRLTVSAWVKLLSPAAPYTRILEKGDDNHETYHFMISDYHLIFGMRDSSENTHDLGMIGDLWPGEWIHIAGTYDLNEMALYVNGELNNSREEGRFTPYNSHDEFMDLGARPPDHDRNYFGMIDDVRVYRRALSAEEIWELYNWTGKDPNLASKPVPQDNATGVSPLTLLSWKPGINALWHDVYFGTDAEDVNNATDIGYYPGLGSTYDPNMDPGELALGRTYTWRVDEVNDAHPQVQWKGELWNFTVDQGKATDGKPDNQWCVDTAVQQLSWTPGIMALYHNVYIGEDYNSVYYADMDSPEYMGTLQADVNNFSLSDLKRNRSYFWRIDEVNEQKIVQGDIWTFNTKGDLCIQVDFALPAWETYEVVPGTGKPGWVHWACKRWADMYMHDVVWFPSDDWGNSPDANGINGSGIHARITTGSEGQLGLHVKGMCRDNLAGDGPPYGEPDGDPIANSWLYAVDWAGEYNGDIVLVLRGLPPGTYELESFHNHWEPCTQSTRNCLDCICGMPPMPEITVGPLPPQGPPGYKWGMHPGTGLGVTSLQNQYNVAPQHTYNDDELIPSVVRFITDGNEVMVLYRAGSNAYPDCARPGREGSRGILNAFRFRMLSAPDEMPEVNIVVPEADSAVKGVVTLTAEASDDSEVTDVEFFVRDPNGGMGEPIGYEDLAAIADADSGLWKYEFDSTMLNDGNYVVVAAAIDDTNNVGYSEPVHFSVRNLSITSIIKLHKKYRCGRTMRVMFTVNMDQAADPHESFVNRRDLKVLIYDADYPDVLLTEALYGRKPFTNYWIYMNREFYSIFFKTKKSPATYVVEIRDAQSDFLLGSFYFRTKMTPFDE